MAAGLIPNTIDRDAEQAAESVTIAPELQEERARLERNLGAFSRQAWTVLEPAVAFRDNWHIGAYAEVAEACSTGQIRKLVVNVPPGFMKSTFWSVIWPAWQWTWKPSTQWLYSSYDDGLATRDSMATRSLIQSAWYQARWADRFRLAHDENLKTRFRNDRTGIRMTTTVAGRGTGQHIDFCGVDDPHNATRIHRKKEREAVLYWWDHAMSNRGNDPMTYVRFIVMQRLHERDLSGHCLEAGGWYHLKIQHEFDRAKRCTVELGGGKTWTDPRTEDGELAWPAQFPKEYVEEQKATLGSDYAGQHGQEPAPDKGIVFLKEHFRTARYIPGGEAGLDKKDPLWVRWKTRYADGKGTKKPFGIFVLPRDGGPPERFLAADCIWAQFADCATKIKEENDFTAVLTAAFTPKWDTILFDLLTCKVIVPDLYATVIAQRQRYPWITETYVEDKNAGESLIQQAAVQGTPFRVLEAEVDKVQRAQPAATAYQQHKIFHLEGQTWVAGLEKNLLMFPNGDHDDDVDTVSYSEIVKNKRRLTAPQVLNPNAGLTPEERARLGID